MILDYFGEKITNDCGICSYCISKKTQTVDIASLSKEILELLKTENLNSREIQNRTNSNAKDVIFVLQELLEKEALLIHSNNKYSIKS